MVSVTVGDRVIGGGRPCFVIAEAGVNHNGSPALALDLVRAAAACGADAVKFQTFRAEALVTAGARKAAYQQRGAAGQTQLEMLKALELGQEAFAELKRVSEELGLVFLSTPFDPDSARLLANLGVAAFKVPSGEVTNHPFLAQIAGFGVPVLMSTGMSELAEVVDAVAVLRANGDPPLALLHCVSAYPAPPDQYNLRAMDSLRSRLGVPVGLSDHTLGWEVALAAAARGADVIEKHLTLDRTMAGPDHAASLEPPQFAEMVGQLRVVQSALGDGEKRPAPCERDVMEVARKSVVAVRDLAAGEHFGPDDLTVKRPGTGIPPRHLADIVGRRLARPVTADTPIAWDDLA
jgi:N,N'-diacetyllegionaminate synthase